jgi:hypothetical protein
MIALRIAARGGLDVRPCPLLTDRAVENPEQIADRMEDVAKLLRGELRLALVTRLVAPLHGVPQLTEQRSREHAARDPRRPRADRQRRQIFPQHAAGLSATNIARLTNEWETECRAFQKRSLADRDYVYVWVDGMHFNVRLEDDRLCTLVMIGVRPDGTKELITVEDGYRESTASPVLRGRRPSVPGGARVWTPVQVWC